MCRKNSVPRPFRSRDLSAAARLSYRQVELWSKSRVLTCEQKPAGWRKFSAAEVLAAALCAEAHARFGIGVGPLRRLQELLARSDLDRALFEPESARWLATDLRTTVRFCGKTGGLGVAELPAGYLVLDASSVLDRVRARVSAKHHGTAPSALAVTGQPGRAAQEYSKRNRRGSGERPERNRR